MKFALSFSILILISTCCYPNQVIYPEYYWLGFSIVNEKEFGTQGDPNESLLTDHIHEDNSAEIDHVSKICKVKYKRVKYREDCSNCHRYLISKKVNKEWTLNKYYAFEKTILDSSGYQWYKPQFKSDFVLNAGEMEKISFISGVFLKYGVPDSSNYNMTLIESPGKAECAFQVLKFLECENVEMKVQRKTAMDGIIWDHIATISFIPSSKFSTYLTEVVKIRSRKLTLTQ